MRSILLTVAMLALVPVTASAAETTLGDCGEGSTARLLAVGPAGPAVWTCGGQDGVFFGALRTGVAPVRLAGTADRAAVAETVVVWQSSAPSYGSTSIARIDRPDQGTAFPAHTPMGMLGLPALATVGNGVLAAWREQPYNTVEHPKPFPGEVGVRVLSRDGEARGPVHVLAHGDSNGPAYPADVALSAAAGGREALVTWTRADGAMWAQRVSRTGVARGRARRVLTRLKTGFGIVVAPTARGYVVAAPKNAAIVTRAIDRRGAPRGPARALPRPQGDSSYRLGSAGRAGDGVALVIDRTWQVPTSASARYGGQDQVLAVRLRADASLDGPLRRVSGPPSPDLHATNGLQAASARTVLWSEGSRVMGAPWPG